MSASSTFVSYLLVPDGRSLRPAVAMDVQRVRRAGQMSGEWVHPGQTLIWAVWVLAAAIKGETPSGRGGLSEDGIGDFPALEDFSLVENGKWRVV